MRVLRGDSRHFHSLFHTTAVSDEQYRVPIDMEGPAGRPNWTAFLCGEEFHAAQQWLAKRHADTSPLPLSLEAAPSASEAGATHLILRQRRDCPHCRRSIMAAATRCGFCWKGLDPIPGATDSGEAGSVDPQGESEEAMRYRTAARRDCPYCGKRGMAAATLCGYCWNRLTPLDSPTNLLRAA